MKVVMLRKNGSYAIVSSYLIGDDAEVPDVEVPDGYYLAVHDATSIAETMSPDQWEKLLEIDADREQKSAAKPSTSGTSVREATAN